MNKNIAATGETFDVGDVAEITIETRDKAGALADPTSLTIQAQVYRQAVQPFHWKVDGQNDSIQKLETGRFLLLYPCALPGRVELRASCTGNAQAAEPGHIDVRESNIV